MKGEMSVLSYRNKKREWGREICVLINVIRMTVLG
jgi:hypothetical protein